MYVERKANSTEPTSLRSDLEKNSKFTERFHDMLQRALNSKPSSRPPKIEMEGLLIPCHKPVAGHLYRYKLVNELSEYLLLMPDKISRIAKTAEWEKVIVKGQLELGNNIFEVEKITLAEADEPDQIPTFFGEAAYDIEGYEKIISQKGKLETATEYIAS